MLRPCSGTINPTNPISRRTRRTRNPPSEVTAHWRSSPDSNDLFLPFLSSFYIFLASFLYLFGVVFTQKGVFKVRGVRISMDGKGRWLDNVYVERLWRSPEQEEVYRLACKTVGEPGKSIANYLR